MKNILHQQPRGLSRLILAENVQLVPADPKVKSAKTCELFNNHAGTPARSRKSADPTCYNVPVGVDDTTRHGLFEKVEKTMTTQAQACAECNSFIAMTLSWPGGWYQGETPEKALSELVGEWGNVPYAMYRVHPDTEMNQMADFIHPRGHTPVRIKYDRPGKWVEVTK